MNGYQFCKYSEYTKIERKYDRDGLICLAVNNLGPQVSFPVTGTLNHNGLNYIALTLWAQDEQGATLGNLQLTPTATIRSGYKKPDPVPKPSWSLRQEAYQQLGRRPSSLVRAFGRFWIFN